ncbi:MAG: hypothetical protein WBQ43_04805 [Terriglobales bacterium]
MKRFKSALTWVPIVAVFLYAIWYRNSYSLLAAWIVILGLYLSNAFERIDRLEKRIEELESERVVTVSSSVL